MKKLVYFLFFFVAFLTACSDPDPKPESIKNVDATVSVEYVEVGPSGVSSKVTEYTFQAIVLDCNSTNAIVRAKTIDGNFNSILIASTAKKLVFGDLVEIIATRWSGPCEMDWKYRVTKVFINENLFTFDLQ